MFVVRQYGVVFDVLGLGKLLWRASFDGDSPDVPTVDVSEIGCENQALTVGAQFGAEDLGIAGSQQRRFAARVGG